MKRNQYWALEIPLGDLRAFTHHGDRRIRLFSGGDSGDGGGGGEVDSVIGEVGGPVSTNAGEISAPTDQGVEGPGQGGVGVAPAGPAGPAAPTGSSANMDMSGGSADIAGLGPSSPSVPGSQGQEVFDALDALQSGNITPGSIAPSTLSQLNDLGMGNVPGFNPNNPTQTVGQMVASQNLHSALNTITPYALSMVPGLAAAVTLQGLLTGKGLVNPMQEFTAAVYGGGSSLSPGGTTALSPSSTDNTGPDGGGYSGGDEPAPPPAVSPNLASELAASGGAGGVTAPYMGPLRDLRVAYEGQGAVGAGGFYGEDDEEARRRRGELPRYEEGGMIGPGGMPMVGGAPRAGVREGVPQATPQGGMQQVQQFAQQHPQQVQEIQREILSGLQSGELQPQVVNRIVQLIQVVLQNPDMYPYVRNFLIQQDVVDEGDLPPQYNEGVVFMLGVIAEAAKGVSGSAASAAGAAPPMESMAMGGTVPDSKKRSGGVIIEAHEGEYVIPAHIVRQKGTDFFDKMIGKDVKAEKGAA